MWYFYCPFQYSNLNSGALGTYILPPEEGREIVARVEEYTKFNFTDEKYYDLDLHIVTCKLLLNFVLLCV